MSLVALGKKVVSDLIDQAKSQNPWKILVVDEYSLKILATATKLFDLAEERISVVEKLSLKRKPIKDMDAIYVVAPTEESVNKIIEDFEPSKRLYQSCHLFFLTALSDELFEKISGSPVSKYIKSFKEANYEFLVSESQVFTTEVVMDPSAPHIFTKLYSPSHSKGRKHELARIGRQVATLCATLGEYPIVRYGVSSTPTTDGPFAKTVAASIQEQIDQFYRINPDAIANDKSRAILLVLDRSFDMVTPLVHDFTYQPMVHDLLSLEGNKYTYQSTDASGKNTAKTATLNEEDEKWKELRHTHIAESVNQIVEEFNKFVKNHQGLTEVNKTDAKGKSLRDVGALIRAAPQYTEQLSKFSLHLNLSQAAMSKYTNDKIEDLARMEQGFATGETAEGDPYKAPTLDEMAAVLNLPGRTNYDKLRVIMLYIIFKGNVTKEEKQTMIEKFGFSDQDREVLDALLMIGLRPEHVPVEQKKGKKKESDGGYELSRYHPRLKKILEKLDEGELSVDEFPYLKEIPLDDDEDSRKRGVSMRTAAKSNWAKGAKKEESSNKGQKVIVFIAGGITYSEMRTVYEITSRDVYLGSTHGVTPKEFVNQVRTAAK